MPQPFIFQLIIYHLVNILFSLQQPTDIMGYSCYKKKREICTLVCQKSINYEKTYSSITYYYYFANNGFSPTRILLCFYDNMRKNCMGNNTS